MLSCFCGPTFSALASGRSAERMLPFSACAAPGSAAIFAGPLATSLRRSACAGFLFDAKKLSNIIPDAIHTVKKCKCKNVHVNAADATQYRRLNVNSIKHCISPKVCKELVKHVQDIHKEGRRLFLMD